MAQCQPVLLHKEYSSPHSVTKLGRTLGTKGLQPFKSSLQLTLFFHHLLLMSVPSRIFRNLNRDAMSGTRFQPHFSQQSSWRVPRDRGRGDHRSGRASLPPALPIPGYAGIHYDTQQLSPVSARRAAEGIEAGFIFEGLESITDGQDRYIAFQLHIPVAIRVYDPVVQRFQQSRVTCNCIDYQSTQSACAHLYVSQSLMSIVLALTCIVAFHTLECCITRRSARKPATNE